MSNKIIIDLSEHNGNVDFKKVKNFGINDVILRVGWLGNKNNNTIDYRFEDNYKKAKQYGFNVGIYAYSYCKTVDTLKIACNWIKEKIKNKKIDLPLFLDLEDITISQIGKDILTEQAVYFCKYFENLGYKSGVYANKFWFRNKLDINKILNYKIWLAEWNGKENHTLNYKVDLWQFTDKFQVKGIKGNVDASKCMCDCEEKEENFINNDEEVFEMVKTYKNGSTIENVYADTNLTKKIGSLNKYETCECLGIVNDRYIVKYKVDNSSNTKIGFVKYSGGVK